MSLVRRALVPHPATPCEAVSSLEAEVRRGPGRLSLRYVLKGRIAALRIPARAPAARTDDLWKHTCFEAFVRPPGDPGYWEFNLSPSTSWAAYAFGRYRERGPDPRTTAPRIAVTTTPQSVELTTDLDLSLLKGAWQVGLSAVVETAEGAKSYWALRHPPGRPDFHHAAGFALTLDPT